VEIIFFQLKFDKNGKKMGPIGLGTFWLTLVCRNAE
jgi:hypothetical protein